MYNLKIPKNTLWDEKNEVFVEIPETVLRIEHSLVSISKWEKKYKKAFLGKKEKTVGELIDYVKCMTLNQNVKDEVYIGMTQETLNEVLDYMEDSQSATYIMDSKKNNKRNRDKPTSEYIYYMMIQNNIPFECEKWNFNRLMNLIKICGVKAEQASGKKRRSTADIARDFAEINNARKAKNNSRG